MVGKGGPEVPGAIEGNLLADLVEHVLLEVVNGEVWQDFVFGTSGLLSEHEICHLLVILQRKVTILIAVVLDALVVVCLTALGHIEVDDVLAIDFQRLEVEVEGRIHHLRIIHILGQGI